MLGPATAQALTDAARRATRHYAFLLRDAAIMMPGGGMIWIDEATPAPHPAGWSQHRAMGCDLGRGLPGLVLALGRAALICDSPSLDRAAQAAAQAASVAPRPVGRGLLTSLHGAALALDPVLPAGWHKGLAAPGDPLPDAPRSWWDSAAALALSRGRRRQTVATTGAPQDLLTSWAGRLAGAGWRPEDGVHLADHLVSCPDDSLRSGRSGLLAVTPSAALTPALADALVWMLEDLSANGPRGLGPAGPLRLSYADGLAGLVAALAGLALWPRATSLGGTPWQSLA